MFPTVGFYDTENSVFQTPRDKPQKSVDCWELGGLAISDTSEPMKYNWYGYVEGKNIYLKRDGSIPVAVLGFSGEVTHISFTFDQNMRPTVAYVEDGMSYLFWYDTSIAASKRTAYPNITDPHLSLDDKRSFNISKSDIIFAYLNASSELCYRVQRERYGTEYRVSTSEGVVQQVDRLINIGMSKENRFLFLIK